MIEKSISVVIPLYNAEKTISIVLDAVLNQTYKPKEIIVVDDGSSDRSSEVVKSFKDIRYVYQGNSGPASARNRGAEEAVGDIIFFTDSDCVPEKDWIEKAIKFFDDPTIGVVSGSYGIANKENLLSRCIHAEIIFRHDKLMPALPKVFGSYNFGIRKDVFDKVKGFNVLYRHASGEDNDLSYKILKEGYRIRFSKDMLVDHYHPVKLKKYLFEQYRHGFWRAKMYIDHPFMVKGDDYTFWKDILEVAVASLIIIVSAATVIFDFFFLYLTASLIFILILLELFFGFLIGKTLNEILFVSFVMFLRSFSRSIGFMAGLPTFFMKFILKK